MILTINKESLFSTFGVDNFIDLDLIIGEMSPSMVEYYLSDLSQGMEDIYLNKRNIQSSIHIGEFSLYLDYDDEIYLEMLTNSTDEYETGTLW